MMTKIKKQNLTIPTNALVATARDEFIRHTRLLGWEGWASPGSEMGRPSAGVFALIVEDNQTTKPVANNIDVLQLDEHWASEPTLLAAALPIFKRAIEGIVQIGDTLLLSAGWKNHQTDLEHSHHGGACWKNGHDSLTMQVYVRHVPASVLSYSGDFDRRARTKVMVCITADGPEAHEAYTTFTQCLAQQAESINAMRDDWDGFPVNDSKDAFAAFRIEGFRLLEDHETNSTDSWFAACPKVYFTHPANLEDEEFASLTLSLANVAEPKPWWQRGKLGVPENLLRALGKLRGSVQFIRLSEFGHRTESRPTRLVISGRLPAALNATSEHGLERGEIRIVIPHPSCNCPELIYKCRSGEEIPPAVIRKLQANVAPYAERFCRKAIMNSMITKL